jgi:hypothetical protein
MSNKAAVQGVLVPEDRLTEGQFFIQEQTLNREVI